MYWLAFPPGDEFPGKKSDRYNDDITFLRKHQNFTKKVKYIGSIEPLFSL